MTLANNPIGPTLPLRVTGSAIGQRSRLNAFLGRMPAQRQSPWCVQQALLSLPLHCGIWRRRRSPPTLRVGVPVDLVHSERRLVGFESGQLPGSDACRRVGDHDTIKRTGRRRRRRRCRQRHRLGSVSPRRCHHRLGHALVAARPARPVVGSEEPVPMRSTLSSNVGGVAACALSSTAAIPPTNQSAGGQRGHCPPPVDTPGPGESQLRPSDLTRAVPEPVRYRRPSALTFGHQGRAASRRYP